jgi:threonine dehydratase
VDAASRRIAAHVRRTPLEPVPALSRLIGASAWIKLECWQRTRSFKVRGAFNAVLALSDAERARGLVTASAGNHGQAVALAARGAGTRATIYTPADAAAPKLARIRELGAELHAVAADYDEAERLAHAHAARTGAVFVHAFSDPLVMAGQGTVALELVEQLPEMAEVVVPVGGGGLISGVGTALRDRAAAVRVIGVQSEETRAMHAAFAAGNVMDVPVTPTLADGLAGCTDDAAYRTAVAVTDELALVAEADIAEAIRVLHDTAGITAEGSAAVGVAAALSGRITVRGPCVFIISGGNIERRRLAQILGS